MEFRFNHLESLHWLWLVLALLVVVAAGFALRKRDLGRFADAELFSRLLPQTSFGRQYLRAGFVVLAMVALVAALIDPRWGVRYRQVQQRGVDLVVILDVSRSMLAEDARPNRLERAKQFIGDLLDQLGGDRVALVSSAGTASLECPLTVDHGAFRLALATMSPETAPRGGSLLGDAIRLAGDAFTDDIPDHKAVIIFTDGEDHGSYPLEAARRLHEERAVPVYTVGIGDSGEGARIPVVVAGKRVYLTYDGQEVWSRMDPSLLREIALTTGGAFVPVGTETVDMGRVYAQRIEPVAKREFETTTVKRHDPKYQWFAGLALLLLVGESLTGDRVSGRRRSLRAAGVDMRVTAGVILLGLLVAAAAPSGPRDLEPAESVPDLLRAAGEAMEAERYEEALGHYERARQRRPDAAEIPFNMGVAAYRAGELDRAAELFDQARLLAEDPLLRAKAAYNLGTTASRKSLGESQDPAAAMARLDDATSELEEALERFREAIDADPDDLDARANGELTYRWLKELEKLEEQMSRQPQPQNQDQSQDQKQDQQDQQDQEQPPQSQDEGSPPQPQDQSPPPSDENQQSPAEADQEESAADQEQEQEQEQEESAEQDASQESERSAASDRKPMTREEAERLLQSVRDKERRRREELARREAARRPPVDKDW